MLISKEVNERVPIRQPALERFRGKERLRAAQKALAFAAKNFFLAYCRSIIFLAERHCYVYGGFVSRIIGNTYHRQ
jgi:hypothetical protein